MGIRIASGVFANSLIRSAYAVGGSAAVVAKGDAIAGSILLIMAEKGVFQALFERHYDQSGRYVWNQKSTQLTEDKHKFDDYISRERHRDPDLWVIELDVPNVERFTADMASGG